jgi:Domain of unknown function (DUF1905)
VSSNVGPVDFSFTGQIGVMVKGDLWSCIEVPSSAELFGTGRAVRVVAKVDEEPLTIALMPTGSGGHMISISAKLRKKLGKDIGDDVLVQVSERLT